LEDDILYGINDILTASAKLSSLIE